MLFNFAGYNKTALYIFNFGLMLLADVVGSILCLQYILHNLILGLAALVYVTMMYLSGQCVGMHKKTSNLICLIYYIIMIIVIGLNLIAFFGLE